MDRRQFLTATTVTGPTLLAGCGASTDSTGTATRDGTPGDSTVPTDSGAGSFRLLISDQPADIGDFDSLDVTFDLDEPTVDLTQVVGDRAIGVLDGEFEPGQYSKIELYVSAVDGVVDGESVDVKVPSNKL